MYKPYNVVINQLERQTITGTLASSGLNTVNSDPVGALGSWPAALSDGFMGDWSV